jgi:hypothetical protein
MTSAKDEKGTQAPSPDEKLQRVQQSLEEIVKRIEPYIRRRPTAAQSTAGRWVQGDSVSLDCD